MKDVPKPISTDDKYFYALITRMDIMIEMMNSMVEVMAEKEDVQTENQTYEEVTVDEDEEDTDLTLLSTEDLKMVAKEVGVKGFGNMKRETLLARLEE